MLRKKISILVPLLSLFNLACGSDSVRVTIFPGNGAAQLSQHSKFLTGNFCKQSQFFAGTIDSATQSLKDAVQVKLNTDFASVTAVPTGESVFTNLLNNPATAFYDEAIQVLVPKGTSVQLALMGAIAFGLNDGSGNCGDFNDSMWGYGSAYGKKTIQAMNDTSVSIPIDVARKKMSIALDGSSQVDAGTQLDSDSGRGTMVMGWVRPRTQDQGVGFAVKPNVGLFQPKDIAITSGAARILVATANGLWASIDDGTSFSLINLGSTAANRIVVSGQNVFVATTGGIWFSNDSGVSFTLVSGTSSPPYKSVFFRNSSLVAIGTANGVDELWYSSDVGVNPIVNLGSNGVSMRDVSIDVSGRVYIATSAKLYVSIPNPALISDFSSHDVSGGGVNNDLNTVYCQVSTTNPPADVAVYVGGTTGLSHSAPFGGSFNWSLYPSNLTNQNIRRIDIDKNANVQVLSDADFGYLNGGVLTSQTLFQFRAPFYGLATSDESVPRLYAVYDGGLLRTELAQTIYDLKVKLDPTKSANATKMITYKLESTFSGVGGTVAPDDTPVASSTTTGYVFPKDIPMYFSYVNELGRTCTLAVDDAHPNTSDSGSYSQAGKVPLSYFITHASDWTCF